MLQQMRSAAKYIWLFVFLAFVGGFLLVETSGLLGSAPLTPTTPVAEVNGTEILYSEWQQRVQQTLQQQRDRQLTQDEVLQVENQVLDEMVMQVLLEKEYRQRGITVSDEELREFARYDPPPFLFSAPELQTDGRFDPQKYQRLLASPQARQGGLLMGLETYYRTEIPQRKLFAQLTDGVYLTEAELWRTWKDEHDSAQVSYVAWRPEFNPDAGKAVPEAEARAYFEAHKSEYEAPGRAWLSIVHIPRVITSADSVASKARALALRNEITRGAKFEDVAKRESADSLSGANGGDLGRGARGRFVPAFEIAAYKLRPKEISEPVLTPFGYHLIRVDEKKGDTLALRHILIPIHQSDSAATATDQRADSLAEIASGAEVPSKLDSAAKTLGLTVSRIQAVEGRPAVSGGARIPSASAWAFGGAQRGDISDLFDDDGGYWMARLDSIVPGGTPRFEPVQESVRQTVARQKSVEQSMVGAQEFSTVAATAGLETAAKNGKLSVIKSPVFTRMDFVPGIGQYTKVIGASFSLAVGSVSAPIRTDEGVWIIRVERRVNADRAAFDKAKDSFRQQRLSGMRQQRVQLFNADLRKTAKVEDFRKEINATARRQQVLP